MEDLEGIFPTHKVVQTKRGDVVIRELVLEDFTILVSEFADLFKEMDRSELNQDNAVLLLSLIKKPEVLHSVRRILGQLTDRPAEFYVKFGITDTMKCIRAFLEVNDIDSIKNDFFEIRRMIRKT